ncbi:MAG: VWA domain-containing protein [Chloroflexota bacterium]|nr:VWA domain-containing protein [Chloroflexota bacterium]
MTILKKAVDFEDLGFRTMMESRDQEAAERICALQLHAYADELGPEISRLATDIQRTKGRSEALCAHLYDRAVPVSDAAMLARGIGGAALLLSLAVACAASVVGHVTTFYLFGLGAILSLALGLTLTGITMAAGHQVFERILVRHKALEAGIIVAAAILCFWGVFQLAQARGAMVDNAESHASSASYVDDPSVEAPIAEAPASGQSLEQKVRQMLGSATIKIRLAADLMLGILLGLLIAVRTNEDYAAWQKLRRLARKLTWLQERRDDLLASIDIAKKRCMAGILRGQNILRKRTVPYHVMLPVLLVVLLLSGPRLFAQTVNREEVILFDASGSIGKGVVNRGLFQEYLNGTRQLLLTEPPNSRVWVSAITTDSFGGSGVILKGWTPGVQGVFTEELDSARRQLVKTFANRSARLSPKAAGTDIFGALWRAKALMESAGHGSQSQGPKTIWIFSDMMNDTWALRMPAQIGRGPEQMMEQARGKGLVVPLKGYEIHVIGASTAGVAPRTWNTVRAFWEMYFREAGANLVSYSPECSVERLGIH